jgi:hypothetical protein
MGQADHSSSLEMLPNPGNTGKNVCIPLSPHRYDKHFLTFLFWVADCHPLSSPEFKDQAANAVVSS